jgi:hypothetical protein
MTATAPTAPAAPARRPLARRVTLPAPARLLRLELRRNIMPWLLPLLAVLFWLVTYRPAMANPPFWNIRSGIVQSHTLLGFAPLLAGAAAWVGSRERRRGVADLVGMTALPRWAGQLAAWAATTCWAEAIYLAGVAVLYAVTARQGAWGGPLWWPVAVGAAFVAASCALGFTAGTLLPSRFTAPLAAFVMFLALAGGAFALQDNVTYAQIWPLNVQGPFPLDACGIFYPYVSDLAIAQLMFLAGLGAAALGALGLPAAAGGRWLRRAAAVVTAAGLVAAGTGVALAGTARLEAHGMVIPALHDAASDQATAYTPVCSHAVVPVCLQPAYRAFLPDVTAAFGPVLSQLADLPGAPVRLAQVAVTSVKPDPSNGVAFGGPVITGRPPVLYLPLAGDSLPGEGSTSAAEFTDGLRALDGRWIISVVVGLSGQYSELGSAGGNVVPLVSPRNAAQVAVLEGLANALGLTQPPAPGAGKTPGGRMPGGGVGTSVNPPGSGAPSMTNQVRAAAQRFTSLSSGARHAWLVTHLAALRAGRISLSEIP